MSDTPVFVVGYMHSGTTLLHNILGAHPAVFSAADETRYFGYLPLIRQLYPNLNDDAVRNALALMLVELIESGHPEHLRTAPPQYQPATSLTDAERHQLLDMVRDERSYGAVFRQVFEFLTRRSKKSRWLEKTPQHVFLIDEILRDVPDAQFVEIRRDPRDILASKKRRRDHIRSATQLDPNDQYRKTLERVYDPFWEALEWLFALRAGQDARVTHAGRVITVRYEDLVMEPEATIRPICDFLGLDFNPNMLDVSWWNAPEGDKARRGFVPDNIGNWTKTLTGSEVALCQYLTGAQMRMSNYALAPTSLRARLGVPWLVMRAGWGLVDRLIRRYRLGGVKFLMNTLKNYWKALRKSV